MRRHNLKEFELSQAYLFYWDKLEKANFFLEQILDTVDEDLTGRLMQTLLASPVGDGGQWDMVANLVNKYGLVSLQHFFLAFAKGLAVIRSLRVLPALAYRKMPLGSTIGLPRLIQRHELTLHG